MMGWQRRPHMAPHVLVIDDDKVLCETLTETLYEDGYDVIGETDAAKALQLIDEAEPDLILLGGWVTGPGR
jgi:DNA-binding response OmpR family regulator